jgi:hypothetical protein
MKKKSENMFNLLGGITPIGKAFVPVVEEELHAIETALGVRLPGEYREFVQRYGVSAFGELVQFKSIEGAVEPLSHFFGSKSAGSNSLMWNIGKYQGRMPDTIIPIADDGGGNQICLGIKGNERGKVYYWDHDNEWDEEDYLEDHGKPMPPAVKFQNVHLVAESFEDFIQRLEKSQGDPKRGRS